MNITTIIPPTVYPVTLEQARAHLRIDAFGSPLEHPDDGLITDHIRAATLQAEGDTHRAFIRQTVRLYAPGFGPIALLRPPLVDLVDVRYYDGANALQVVDPADYYVTNDRVAQLRFVTGFGAPTVYGRGDAVRIDYRAGYAPTASPDDEEALREVVPQDVKSAILLGVQQLYESLTPDAWNSIERARKALLWQYVIPVIA